MFGSLCENENVNDIIKVTRHNESDISLNIKTLKYKILTIFLLMRKMLLEKGVLK